eukprot:scaffold135140_cov31-Tisochrysis_lutea.AAC.4
MFAIIPSTCTEGRLSRSSVPSSYMRLSFHLSCRKMAGLFPIIREIGLWNCAQGHHGYLAACVDDCLFSVSGLVLNPGSI